MPRRFLRAFLLLTILSPLAPAQGLAAAQEQAIDRICKRFASPRVPGVAVAVTRRGKLVFQKGYGCAQLEYSHPITADTIFHVASVTKQFTAFALVLLAADGRLTLEDDVRTHVPWIHDFGHTITIRHLLNHTSGLRDQWELLVLSGLRLDDVLTKDHILRILRHQRELNFRPGSRYLYSNMGYTLAARIVERVSGQSFASFCEERIFVPLGMARSHIHTDHQRIVPGRAYSYGKQLIGWHKGNLNYANAGATSLFTTAPDLARWLHNFASGKVGGEAAIRNLLRRGQLGDGRAIDYALGVMHGTHNHRPTIGHGGADAGFRSDVLWIPEAQLGVVALSNASNANPGRITRQIADAILGPGEPQAPKPRPGEREPARAAQPAPPMPEDLDRYAGRYYCPELEVFYEIHVDGARIRAHHRRHGDIPLRARGGDVCTGRPFFFRRVRFLRDKAGTVNGFRLTGSRVLNLAFERVPTSPPRRDR